MKKVLALLACLLSTPATAQQVLTQFGQDPSGSPRKVYVLDPTNDAWAAIGQFTTGTDLWAPAVGGATAGDILCANGGVVADCKAIGGSANLPTTLVMTIPTGLTQGVLETQNLSGAVAVPLNANQWLVNTDVVNFPGAGSFVNDFTFQGNFGGGAMEGGREVLIVYGNLTAPSNVSNGNHNYVALTGDMTALSSDNGTGVTAGTALGSIFGLGAVGVAENGATNLYNVTGAELNVSMQTGSSVYAKSILQLAGRGDDAVSGSGIDAILWIYNQGGATSAFKDAILLDNNGGSGLWPLNTSTGSLWRTAGAGTANYGLNWSNTTFGTASISVPGLTVGPIGQTSIALGTLTTSVKGISVTATFNASGTVFDAPIFENITETAEAAGSLLLDVEANSVTEFGVYYNGEVYSNGNFTVNGAGTFGFNGRSQFDSSANGTMKTFQNNGSTYSDFWAGNFYSGGSQGLAQTCTVNQAKTLIFSGGILTGGTCNS